MPKTSGRSNQKPLDLDRFVNVAQVGGIESYVINDGPGRGVRALCVNTGAGLRYRVLVDRGLDIDHAFFNQFSLTHLTHKGVTPPTRAVDHDQDWLMGFPGGLLTSCGPFNIGGPCTDNGEKLGLHGQHSSTPATLESVLQPDPRDGVREMTITGLLRYGAFYGPNVELRRTITSMLGENSIEFADEFFNAGNTEVPHAWLLHINFGYPLLDRGGEFCYDATKVEPMAGHTSSEAFFKSGNDYKRVRDPDPSHDGTGSAVGYVYPRVTGRDGLATVGVINPRLNLGLAIHYSTKQFPRCGNWQHWGRHEYIAALEPMNGTVEGRDKDRARGLMDTLKPGQRKAYRYRIDVVTSGAGIDSLRRLNRRR